MIAGIPIASACFLLLDSFRASHSSMFIQLQQFLELGIRHLDLSSIPWRRVVTMPFQTISVK